MDYMLFASVLKVFLQKSFTKKNHEICHKSKKSFLGPAV